MVQEGLSCLAYDPIGEAMFAVSESAAGASCKEQKAIIKRVPDFGLGQGGASAGEQH